MSKVKKQFKFIKKVLKNNTSTIEQLLKEQNKIEEIIQKLKREEDFFKKSIEEIKSLEKIANGISNSIDSLIKNTKDIFHVYQLLMAQMG